MPGELCCPLRWWHIQVMARHEWCHCVWPQVIGLVLHNHSPDPSLYPQPSAGFESQGRCPGELHTKPPDFKCPQHHDGNVTFRAELLLWVPASIPEAECDFSVDAMAHRVLHGWERIVCAGEAVDGS